MNIETVVKHSVLVMNAVWVFLCSYLICFKIKHSTQCAKLWAHGFQSSTGDLISRTTWHCPFSAQTEL